MKRTMAALVGFGVILGVSGSARASAIQIGVRGQLGDRTFDGSSRYDLPSGFQGGIIDLGAVRADGLADLGSGQVRAVDGPFRLEVDFYRPGDATASAAVYLNGTIQGQFSRPDPGASTIVGGFDGVATASDLTVWYPTPTGVPEPIRTAMLAAYAPGPGVPQEVLGLFADPSHIHVAAFMTDGVANHLDYQILVDPASSPVVYPVPEPAALATLAAGLAWLARRRTRGARAPKD